MTDAEPTERRLYASSTPGSLTNKLALPPEQFATFAQTVGLPVTQAPPGESAMDKQSKYLPRHRRDRRLGRWA